jgi:hypothetical protein
LCRPLTGLLSWILLLRGWRGWRGMLPEELSAHKHHPTHEKKHGKKSRRFCLSFPFHEASETG